MSRAVEKRTSCRIRGKCLSCLLSSGEDDKQRANTRGITEGKSASGLACREASSSGLPLKVQARRCARGQNLPTWQNYQNCSLSKPKFMNETFHSTEERLGKRQAAGTPCRSAYAMHLGKAGDQHRGEHRGGKGGRRRTPEMLGRSARFPAGCPNKLGLFSLGKKFCGDGMWQSRETSSGAWETQRVRTIFH